MEPQKEREIIQDALDHLDPTLLPYDRWLGVGMALKAEGLDLADWDAWSQRDSARYKPGDCVRRWAGLDTTGGAGAWNGGSIIALAREQGYDAWAGRRGSSSVGPPKERGPQRLDGLEPKEQLVQYLKALFRPAEVIGYNLEARANAKGKLGPCSAGVYTRTAGEVIEALEAGGLDAIGAYDQQAGGWIRLNPLDGKGAADANVTDFRHVLLESDDLPVKEQLAFLLDSGLPLAAIVDSGSKSIHGIVKVQAGDREEYTQRVKVLYDTLKDQGFPVDAANKNPSRLSRMPGLQRGERMQRLLYTNVGANSWEEWAESLEGWEEPIPFSTPEPPPFPMDCLPDGVRVYAQQLAAFCQVDPAMVGVSVLGVLATCFQRKYKVEVLPGYTETLSLFTLAVAGPGELKSPVIKHLTAPIREYQMDRRKEEAVLVAESQSRLKVLTGRKEALEKKLSSENGDQTHQDQLSEVIEELAEYNPMHPYRVLMDDATPEALVNEMARQGGSIAIASAEGGVFSKMQGREAGKMNDAITFYLSGYSGEGITVDRIGRASNDIPEAHLSLTLAVQPSVLEEILGNRDFMGRGLNSRFLYAMCEPKAGTRIPTPPYIDMQVEQTYQYTIKTFLGDVSESKFPFIMLSTEAGALREAFFNQNEAYHRTRWDNDAIRTWANKMLGQTIRIAGLIHCAERVKDTKDPTTELIEQTTMQRAITIMECLIAHAERAFNAMGANPDMEDARYLLGKLEAVRVRAVNARDLLRKYHRRFTTRARLDTAANILAEYGYLRVETVGTGKRPKTLFVLNPVYFGRGKR